MKKQLVFSIDQQSIAGVVGIIISFFAVFTAGLMPQQVNQVQDYPKALASYDDFKNLVEEVERHRAERLVSLDDFLEMAKDPNTVILDTRAKFRYDRKHIKRAIHLSFTEFTHENLRKTIPDNSRVLIYCNNNFAGDPIDFASKVSVPPNLPLTIDASTKDAVRRTRAFAATELSGNQKPIMLALNIPSYLNLYGYGYENVYELDELVNIYDSRIEFEGTEVE